MTDTERQIVLQLKAKALTIRAAADATLKKVDALLDGKEVPSPTSAGPSVMPPRPCPIELDEEERMVYADGAPVGGPLRKAECRDLKKLIDLHKAGKRLPASGNNARNIRTLLRACPGLLPFFDPPATGPRRPKNREGWGLKPPDSPTPS